MNMNHYCEPNKDKGTEKKQQATTLKQWRRVNRESKYEYESPLNIKFVSLLQHQARIQLAYQKLNCLVLTRGLVAQLLLLWYIFIALGLGVVGVGVSVFSVALSTAAVLYSSMLYISTYRIVRADQPCFCLTCRCPIGYDSIDTNISFALFQFRVPIRGPRGWPIRTVGQGAGGSRCVLRTGTVHAGAQ